MFVQGHAVSDDVVYHLTGNTPQKDMEMYNALQADEINSS